MNKEKIYLSLVMEEGVVELSCGLELWGDEVRDVLFSSIKKGGMFNEEGWDTLEMTFNGEEINMLNCKKLIGII